MTTTEPARPTAEPITARALQTVIEPTHGWRALDLREMWRFRDLLRSLVVRDIKLRYRQTALGVFWVLLQPLISAAVFTFVFGRVARLPSGPVPYFLIALTGMLTWTLFSGVLQRGSQALVANAALVGKVFFPRLLLPISAVGSGLIDVAGAATLVIALAAANGVFAGFSLLLLPVWLLLAILLALGPAIATSALTVAYRDVAYVIPVAMQALLFLSPVGYDTTAVPERFRSLYELNPLVAPIQGVRSALLGLPGPSLISVTSSALCAAVLLVLASVYFTRHERRFADVI